MMTLIQMLMKNTAVQNHNSLKLFRKDIFVVNLYLDKHYTFETKQESHCLTSNLNQSELKKRYICDVPDSVYSVRLIFSMV